MHKPGTIPPVIYFVNHTNSRHPVGYLELATYSAEPTPDGFSREEAGTLREAYALQTRLQEQAYQERRAEYEMDQARWAERKQRVRDSLMRTLASSSTSEYEKEFIRLYLQLRDGEKRKKYESLWLQRTSFLWALEMDSHGRDPASEEFDPMKMEIRG